MLPPVLRTASNPALRQLLQQLRGVVSEPAGAQQRSLSGLAAPAERRSLPNDDHLSLQHFINQAAGGAAADGSAATAASPAAAAAHLHPPQPQRWERTVLNFFVETYGCQMNVNDSEVVASVLRAAGYGVAATADAADVVLLNTCAIRENAEAKVRRRVCVCGGWAGTGWGQGCWSALCSLLLPLAPPARALRCVAGAAACTMLRCIALLHVLC